MINFKNKKTSRILKAERLCLRVKTYLAAGAADFAAGLAEALAGVAAA
jgi:hypothetical protein